MKNLFSKLFSSTEVASVNYKRENYKEPADFETAIAAAGFGKFNILLLLIAIPACWASVFQTTTMSYVFPAAQCDLHLSLEDKGMLNAITYAGTMSSAFLWGFLVDTLGRRKLLIIGFLLDGCFVILSGFAQNVSFLMVTKFLGGFIINGPFSALTSYLSEMNNSSHRSRIPLVMGLFSSVGCIYLPLVASLILPMEFELRVFEDFVFHSWGLYLLVNALPSLLSGLAFFFLPESPKFFMSMGKNEEALRVFEQIYSLNTGQPRETYPINELIQEKKEETVPSKIASTNGWNQIRLLFRTPFLNLFILVCSMTTLTLLSSNTLRLWLPQIFQAMNDYKFFNNGTSSSLCDMLKILQPSDKKSEDCFVNFNNLEVYLNSMTVSITATFVYVVAVSLINVLGSNKLLAITSCIGGSFALGILFSPNSLFATICIAGCSNFVSIGTDIILVIIVNLFPTTLRTMAVSLALMFGRSGAMVGNVVFPYLLEIGCAPPFLAITVCGFACSAFTLLLPKRNENFT